MGNWDDWTTVTMWCEDCDQAVEAILEFDPDTGARDAYCPNNPNHELVDARECRTEGCDSYVPRGTRFCKWCMADLKIAAKKFVEALPVGMDIIDALEEADDNRYFEEE